MSELQVIAHELEVLYGAACKRALHLPEGTPVSVPRALWAAAGHVRVALDGVREMIDAS